jgi:hypothetical protein
MKVAYILQAAPYLYSPLKYTTTFSGIVYSNLLQKSLLFQPLPNITA